MPRIQNVSYVEIEKGTHLMSEDMVLIQIVDPCMRFPKPKFEDKFNKIFKFRFLDTDPEDLRFYESCFLISEDDAYKIVTILKDALANGSDVVVQCYAGVARSGAVVELGLKMGFEDTKEYRSANLYILGVLMDTLKKYPN